LLVERRRARVQNLNDHIRLGHLFEGGAKGGDQVGRKLLDETDGVRQQKPATRGQLEAPSGRVERGEKAVLGANLCSRQSVEERRLARICVADDGGGLELRAPASDPLLVALGPDLLDLAVEVADPLANPPALRLDLLLARTAARPDSPAPAANLAVVRV